MLWLFDCQRTFVHDVLALKSVNDVVALVIYALRKWRRIGWKNVCKLWLQERTSEPLKGEGGY